MARPLRIEFDGAVYHITSRGNERKDIFGEDEDREQFLEILYRITKQFNWLCHAYCLMGNHYHLVVETPEGNLSKGMRQLNGIYTQRYNRRHKRVGHLFQGRYKAIVIEKESHLLEVCRYVVLNPVRAGFVKKPEEWEWSSYRAMAGIGLLHQCLTVEWVLSQFGKRAKMATRKYREFIMAGVGEESIWKAVRGQVVLGREGFVEKITDYLSGKSEIKEIPRKQRHLNRPGLDELFTKEVIEVIKERGKRDKRIYEAVTRYGYSQSDVARATGLHYSWVSRIVHRKDKEAKDKT